MKRFFGMMPQSEIEREEIFREKETGDELRIQAGPNGWSVIYCDGSSTYGDDNSNTEINFKSAYMTAVKEVGEIENITREDPEYEYGEI